jgi:hypothetical protein
VSRPGDELLAVVAARRELPWRAFRDAFDVLHSRALAFRSGLDEPVGLLRPRSLRLLSELAHAELPPYEASTAVAAAPTVLARLPQPGLPRAVLCGSRGLDAAALLREACSPFGVDAGVVVVAHPYSGGYAPAAIGVEATDEQVLQRVAERAGIRFAARPPAWDILSASACVADYDSSLRWSTDLDPVWPRKDFNPATLVFGFERRDDAPRFSVFMDPITHRQIHRIWREGVSAVADRDWGRWLHLRDLSRDILLVDPGAQALAVPATVPLPRLLARALALFSGLAPRRQPHPDDASLLLDVYAAVPSQAAEVVAAKLGQQLLTRQLRR